MSRDPDLAPTAAGAGSVGYRVFDVPAAPRARARAQLGRVPLASLLLAFAGLWAAPAAADDLAAQDAQTEEAGYAPIQELSHEVFVEPGSRSRARLRIRMALNNASSKARDAVLTLALPRTSRLRGLRVARDGVWRDGEVSSDPGRVARRDPGSVYARPVPPATATDLPAAEVVLASIPSGATIQVELVCDVVPRLRGDRWELDLPGRGRRHGGLAAVRRVLVPGAPQFFVDETASAGAPMLPTPGDRASTVSWPAKSVARGSLEGRLEVLPDAFGGGEVRMVMRLGAAAALRPDHVTLLVDRSASTSPHLQRRSLHLARGLLAALSTRTTFDAVGFAREAEPLAELPARTPISDPAWPAALDRSLDGSGRTPGTNVLGALSLATQRAGRAARPLVVIVTDGMLPTTLAPAEIRRALRRGEGRRPADVLLVVDTPADAETPDAEHPAARFAAAVGGRLAALDLARFEAEDVTALLASPPVLTEFGLELPAGVTLREATPAGLVAGRVLTLEGSYRGRAPRSVRVTGRLGRRKLTRTLRAQRVPRPPVALAASYLDDPAGPAEEGFALPPWYPTDRRRLALAAITREGRGNDGVRGTLTPEIVRGYLRIRVLPRVAVCHRHAVARARDQQGRVELEFEIARGEVMLVRVRSEELAHPDPKLVACVVEAGWHLDVPAARRDDRVYVVRYPITLEPAPKGQAGRAQAEGGEASLDAMLERQPRHGAP